VSVFVEYESDVAEERQRVESLLTSLRIKAAVRVFWLASGELKTYEVIVNGKGGPGFGQALQEVDDVLEDEEWWQEIKTARNEGLESETFRQLSDLSSNGSPGVDSDLRRGSFHPLPMKTSSTTVKGLRRIMRKAKRRVSVGPLNRFPTEMRLQLSSLDPNLIETHRAYSSSSESSSSDEDDFNAYDSDGGAASENDLESSSDDDERHIVHRSKSFHSSSPHRPSVRSPISTGTSGSTIQARSTPLLPKARPSETVTKGESSALGQPKSAVNTLRRPPTIRHHSMPKFTSKPVPPTTISTEDGPGPSIMFAEQTPPSAMHFATQAFPNNPQSTSLAEEPDGAGSKPAGGFPAQQAVPLSFNDLPSRAQHLILNDLMARHSEFTAVLFTTLPSPVEGTCDSDVDSIRYLSDVEVLCANLPPLLLVHSNTVTVTMSL
jgi:potassium/chloride transporter 9